MPRKDLIPLLLDRPHTLVELARILGRHPRDVENDLHHLFRSLRNGPYRPVIEPARCRRCGFVFRDDKLHKPGRCPRCRGDWIEPPRVGIGE